MEEKDMKMSRKTENAVNRRVTEVDAERIKQAVELLGSVKVTSFPNSLMAKAAADLVSGYKLGGVKKSHAG